MSDVITVWIILFWLSFLPQNGDWNTSDSPVQVGRYRTEAECHRIHKELENAMRGTWTIHGPRPDRISPCYMVVIPK